MFALADCNNFFVSCERVFRPDLEGRPVIVLSRNDGCAIARSNEAKALGVKMGDPYFKLRDLIERNNIAVFSGNMALYADFSRRIRSILREVAPQIEVYSIDEAFLDMRGVDNVDFDTFSKGLSMRCRKLTGIPVSVGVAPTKTLAKIAAQLCKSYPKLRGGCFMHRDADIEKVLKRFPIEDVWGIGRRSAPRLKEQGVNTAYDFYRLNEGWIMRRMGVVGLRTWRELHGIPAIGFDSVAEPRQSICNSRSFSSEIYDIGELSEQIAKFAAMTAERLREQHSVCSRLTVFAATNRFHTSDIQQCGHITIPLIEPTDSTLAIVRASREALAEIFVRGAGYKKAGVIASAITPREGTPISMFSAESNERHHRLMQAIDEINRKSEGRGIVLASEGHSNVKALSRHRSPRYTTSWDELPVVKL
ncbi:MAG: Y-family DNA polymerase [Rikenellaceae bacterium]|nr:Y-family DNA polymerase [Rikenellaceae bacterium]